MSLTVFLIVVGAALIHATWNFLEKEVHGNPAVLAIGAATGAILLVPLALYMGTDVAEIRAGAPFFLLTGMIHALYYLALGRAYRRGEITVVFPLARGAGVAGTALVAASLLGESLTLFGSMGIICISAGAILVGFASHSHRRLPGVRSALLVAITVVAYTITDKLAVDVINPAAYAVGLFGTAATLLMPYLLIRHRDVISTAWKEYRPFCFGVGIGQVGVYVVILFVYQIAQVSYVAAVREMSVVFAAVLGFMFLKEKLTLKKSIGIAVIALGLVLVKIA
ncbi:EamA family transporter [Patescibacteria group bacterium]